MPPATRSQGLYRSERYSVPLSDNIANHLGQQQPRYHSGTARASPPEVSDSQEVSADGGYSRFEKKSGNLRFGDNSQEAYDTDEDEDCEVSRRAVLSWFSQNRSPAQPEYCVQLETAFRVSPPHLLKLTLYITLCLRGLAKHNFHAHSLRHLDYDLL